MAPFTAADIEAEHLCALSRLDAEQRAALRRTREALRRGNFSHRTFKQSLLDVLSEEVAAAPPRGGHLSAADNMLAMEDRHLDALASLDPGQRDALHRIERALQMNNFSHHTLKETLQDLFEQEADSRNRISNAEAFSFGNEAHHPAREKPHG